ncbi:MAG: DNA mismatch repair protein MutS [Pseudomonadota bacterium]
MSDPRAAVTPMMAQFIEIKAGYPDALLFYRMGDFYELFFDDAVAASQALDIALTKRGKHLGEDIPMCGVPVHSAEGYLLTLIRKGFRVAVCEQLEDPSEAKKRGSKSVVKRGVTRLVTPGTLTEDSLLNARSNNFLAAYAEVRGDAALAWTDISTGEIWVMSLSLPRLGAELARLAPREVLILDSAETDLAEIVTDVGASVTPRPRVSFDSTSGEKRLLSLWNIASLDAFGGFARHETAALGAIADYIEITQRGKLPLLRPPVRESSGGNMAIDAATRRNLEITRALDGSRSGALLATIDRTVTAAGGRLLERRLASPSCDLELIRKRHDAVGAFFADRVLREDVQGALRKAPDLDRALSRLALDRGGPRDLAAVRDGLAQAGALADRLSDRMPALIENAARDLSGHEVLADALDAALVAEPPLLARDGGFIAPGTDVELDEARTLRDEGRGVIAGMQADYAQITGISSLKVKHNNVLGYFIETTATHAEKMMTAPLSETFIHRQTTASAVRFTTVDLSEMETKILNAGARALDIEMRLYSSLKHEILENAAAISTAARALAEIDLAAALGDIAETSNWTRPEVDGSRAFDVEGGRHPVVEASLSRAGDAFIPNHCDLNAADTAAIWLLTGPNMAGKSTFLRQNALIALLAQTGSFVPATRAHIGLVSQLFSRVGASDDLARGRSTFMVEMVETAAILNQADTRALVILDEIGRGTATYDGLSIASATLEYLHETNQCRALFATHYHEMTVLSETLAGVQNATVAVKEFKGDVIFLHEVRMGAADRSYGVQVARLAGLPAPVIARARQVLDTLEARARDGQGGPQSLVDDLPLFSVAPPQPATKTVSKSAEMLADVHPDDLTPREALDLIYRLKKASVSDDA